MKHKNGKFKVGGVLDMKLKKKPVHPPRTHASPAELAGSSAAVLMNGTSIAHREQ